MSSVPRGFWKLPPGSLGAVYDDLVARLSPGARDASCSCELLGRPPCWRLLTDPVGTLTDRARWPAQVCVTVAQELTLRWASGHLSRPDPTRWPYPDDGRYAGADSVLVAVPLAVPGCDQTGIGLASPDPAEPGVFFIGGHRVTASGASIDAIAAVALRRAFADWWATLAGQAVRAPSGPKPLAIDWDAVEAAHASGRSLEDIADAIGLSRRQFMTRWTMRPRSGDVGR